MSDTPWWRTDGYTLDVEVPDQFAGSSGPNGVALVRAYADGKTDPGWGRDTFMELYQKGQQFRPTPIIAGYRKKRWAFAYIMRSVSLVCVDIDGKNGGLEHAKHLGPLPPTLAETSKSGNGFHLFYEVEDVWSDTDGFARLNDHIGIVQGVDFRSTGCVYHYPTQRWNGRYVAPLPKYMLELLETKQQKQLHHAQRITSTLNSDDPMEILMLRDELMQDLAKPIPDGRRNNTLFAIGQKMKAADVEDWPKLIADRAYDLGIDVNETDKLIANIERY